MPSPLSGLYWMIKKLIILRQIQRPRDFSRGRLLFLLSYERFSCNMCVAALL